MAVVISIEHEHRCTALLLHASERGECKSPKAPRSSGPLIYPITRSRALITIDPEHRNARSGKQRKADSWLTLGLALAACRLLFNAKERNREKKVAAERSARTRISRGADGIINFIRAERSPVSLDLSVIISNNNQQPFYDDCCAINSIQPAN